MKIKMFPLTVLLLSLSWHSRGQTASVDTLVQTLFFSLKNKDEKAYMKIFPSYQETRNMFRKSVEKMKDNATAAPAGINMDSVLDAEFSKFTEETYKTEIQEALKKSFQSVLKQGEEKGLNWNRIELASYRLDTIKETDMNLSSVKGILNIKDSAREYEVFFTDVLFFEDEQKWYGASLNKIVRKGEQMENEDTSDSSVPDEKTETKQPPAPPAKSKKPPQKPKR
jgi:hypothetical protein